MSDDDLREMAIKLSVEEGRWTDCRPLFAEVWEVVKKSDQSGPIRALEQIRTHLERLENERWESLKRSSWAQVAMLRVYQWTMDLLTRKEKKE